MTRHYPKVAEIIEAVAAAYDIPHARELLTKSRGMAHVAEARMVAMALTRYLTGMSYPAIGRAFRRDHTTAMHAVEKLEAQPWDSRMVERHLAVLGSFAENLQPVKENA